MFSYYSNSTNIHNRTCEEVYTHRNQFISIIACKKGAASLLSYEIWAMIVQRQRSLLLKIYGRISYSVGTIDRLGSRPRPRLYPAIFSNTGPGPAKTWWNRVFAEFHLIVLLPATPNEQPMNYVTSSHSWPSHSQVYRKQNITFEKSVTQTRCSTIIRMPLWTRLIKKILSWYEIWLK